MGKKEEVKRNEGRREKWIKERREKGKKEKEKAGGGNDDSFTSRMIFIGFFFKKYQLYFSKNSFISSKLSILLAYSW